MFCRQIRILGMLATFSVLTAIGASATACSNASIKGVYGLLITGYDSSGQYQQGMGQINSNGKGSFTGTETVSDDGTIYDNVSITGTYSIAANCTGSGTIINAKNGSESHYNFAVDLVAKQVEAAGTDSGHGTASGYAIEQGKATCSVAAVKGTYGFHGGGFTNAGGEWQFSGQYVFDGAGNLSGTETTVSSGVVTSAATITGTYTVASGCTGTLTYQLNGSAPSYNLNTVFVGGAKSFLAIETDSGFVGTLVAHE